MTNLSPEMQMQCHKVSQKACDTIFNLLKERYQMKNRDELEECLEIALNAFRCGEPDKCQAHIEKAYELMVYGLKPELEQKT